LFCVVVIVFVVSCDAKNFLAKYTVGNYGEYGLLIHQIGPINFMEKYGKPSRDHPGIPGVRDDHVPGGFGDQFPIGSQEIVWQLAELSECQRIREARSYDKRFSGNYTRKKGNCKWNPLPTIYRQTIDFDQIRQSPEYQAATKFRWNVLDNSKYGVQILFAFKDSEVTMHLNYFKTNPWK
jgi:hypothetical protein